MRSWPTSNSEICMPFPLQRDPQFTEDPKRPSVFRDPHMTVRSLMANDALLIQEKRPPSGEWRKTASGYWHCGIRASLGLFVVRIHLTDAEKEGLRWRRPEGHIEYLSWERTARPPSSLRHSAGRATRAGGLPPWAQPHGRRRICAYLGDSWKATMDAFRHAHPV